MIMLLKIFTQICYFYSFWVVMLNDYPRNTKSQFDVEISIASFRMVAMIDRIDVRYAVEQGQTG